MPAQYLKWDETSRSYKEVTAITQSAGAADAGKIIATNSAGGVDESFLPIGDGARAFPLSQALSAGDFVNVYDDGGVAKLRKADASSPATRAHGFVREAGAEGENVKMYGSGVLEGFADLTVGATYVLSDTTPGEATLVSPSASGHIAQIVGTAVSPTEIQVDIAETIVVRA